MADPKHTAAKKITKTATICWILMVIVFAVVKWLDTRIICTGYPPMLTPETLLERSDQTARVLAHARLLMRLEQRFAASVPAGLAEHARVVNYRSGTIVIHAANGAVAAKLKQISLRLRDSFVKIGLECNQIEVKVQPIQNLAQSTTSSVKPMSCESVRVLSACADSMPKESPLAQALRHLLDRAAIRQSAAPAPGTAGQTESGQKSGCI